MTLTITNIPRIMRAQGWLNGARLQDIWFAGVAAEAPGYGAPDTTTIKMDDWALTFPRMATVYDAIVADQIWANAPAQAQIRKMLSAKGLLTDQSVPFGDLTAPVDVLDSDYINQRLVSYDITDDLDDMVAALGRFTVRVAVSGGIDPTDTATWQVTIDKVGIYIRDSFDFEGDQFLGFWNDSDDTVSAVDPTVGTEVTNADYRNWRDSTGMGGDYLVYSDVKEVIPDPPSVFVLGP